MSGQSWAEEAFELEQLEQAKLFARLGVPDMLAAAKRRAHRDMMSKCAICTKEISIGCMIGEHMMCDECYEAGILWAARQALAEKNRYGPSSLAAMYGAWAAAGKPGQLTSLPDAAGVLAHGSARAKPESREFLRPNEPHRRIRMIGLVSSAADAKEAFGATPMDLSHTSWKNPSGDIKANLRALQEQIMEEVGWNSGPSLAEYTCACVAPWDGRLLSLNDGDVPLPGDKHRAKKACGDCHGSGYVHVDLGNGTYAVVRPDGPGD
jgi:hypothetical protein